MNDLKELLVRDVLGEDFVTGEKKLLKEAEALLGYVPEGGDPSLNAFEKKLRSMEITWFTEESVEAYKKEKLQQETRQLVQKYMDKRNFFFRCLAKVCKYIPDECFLHWQLLGVGSAGGGYNWSVPQYEGELPKDALALAVQIKKAQKNTVFMVDQLEAGRYTRQNAYDPFLCVKLRGVEQKPYYIAVWDEPGFKAEVVR